MVHATFTLLDCMMKLTLYSIYMPCLKWLCAVFEPKIVVVSLYLVHPEDLRGSLPFKNHIEA